MDDGFHIVSGIGLVNQTDVVGLDGIELADVIIYSTQGFKDCWAQGLCGIGEHTHFCLRRIVVAKGKGVINDFRKVGMERGFAVA